VDGRGKDLGRGCFRFFAWEGSFFLSLGTSFNGIII
jgi:hypothetical protein